MQPATKKDKQNVVRIIEESFKGTPSVTWVVKNDHKKEKRLKALAEYIFDIGFVKNGVYISNDKDAVAVIFRFNNYINKLALWYHEARLLVRAIGIRKMFKVLKRQSYIKKQKPESGDFLYFWVYGASNEGKGRGGAHELQREIFHLSYKLNLPIYMETTVAQNKAVYERYGFVVYHTWKVEEQGINVWFMKREAALIT